MTWLQTHEQQKSDSLILPVNSYFKGERNSLTDIKAFYTFH